MITEILLKDQTTGKNILWANATEYEKQEIKLEQIYSIKPRHEKLREHQKQRTRDRAEIFTPPEVCKIQNELMDEAWLKSLVIPWLKDKENLSDDSPTDKAIIESDFQKIAAVFFNRECATPIDTIVAAWCAENKELWQTYIDAKFLEITCGEAPYLVNRYNAVTGDPVPLAERIGLLDRKLRVVNKETSTLKDWTEYAIRAVKSIYGYEFQGDNLYLARRNVFETVKDYYAEKFQRKPPDDFLREVAQIISWNLWQMDGLSKTYSPPFIDAKPEASLFDAAPQGEIFCLIMDWKENKTVKFKDLVKGAQR